VGGVFVCRSYFLSKIVNREVGLVCGVGTLGEWLNSEA